MQPQCPHQFSWPLRAADGRYYRTCTWCGNKHEFDWKQMRGIEEGPGIAHRGPSRPIAATARPLTLLPARESAVRTFAGNLLFCLRSQPRTVTGYRPGTIWRNVFVPSGAPWRWFGRSLVCHAVAIAVVVAVFRPSKVTARRPEISSNSQITYYVRPSTFPAREARPSVSLPRRSARTAIQPQAAIRVAPGRKSATLIAPQIKLPRSAGTGIAALGKGIVAPAPPSSALSQFHLKAVPGAQVSAVGPAPELHQNLRGALSLSQGPIIGPPSNLAGIPSQRKGFTPGSTVVAPPPSIQGLQHSPNSVTVGNSTAVAPAPQITAGGSVPYGRAGAPSLGSSSNVVAPSPQIAGTGSTRKGALPQAVAVAPAPSMQGLQPGVATSRAENLGVGYVPAVAPAPEVSATAGISGELKGSPLIGAQSASVIPPPPSIQGSGTTAGGTQNSSRPGNDIKVGAMAAPSEGTETSPTASASAEIPPPEAIDNTPAGAAQELSLHLVGLASALPTSSYFSNYEVFIAERRVTRLKSQLIKLVYMFLPYQRRLSEYGVTNLRMLKLRVRRDPTCDESLLDMTWPDSESRAKSQDVANSAAKPANSNMRLPCYRTSADDYRKALAKTRQ